MFRRIVEILVSLFLIPFVYLPVISCLFIRKLTKGKAVFITDSIYLRNQAKLKVRYFNIHYPFVRSLGLYPEVIKGKIGITGVSIRSTEFFDSGLEQAKPGILSIWFLRKLNKIDYDGRDAIDKEYLQNKSIKKDLLIVVKSLLAFSIKDEEGEVPERINLLGVNFRNLDMEEAVSLIESTVSDKRKESFFFMNPDCFNKLYTDAEYFEIMKKATNVFPDGSGVNMACKIIGKTLKQNINGTDMLPYLCGMAQAKGYGMFLLGAKPGVAEKMKKNLEQKYNEIIISGVQDGYFDRQTGNDEVIEKINNSGAKILLVAFGAPNQEKWIYTNLQKLDVHAAIGVGGLFDFYSGNMPRAPKWMRELGIEWVFRLIKEPGRMWRRYIIGNPLFLQRVRDWNKAITGKKSESKN